MRYQTSFSRAVLLVALVPAANLAAQSNSMVRTVLLTRFDANATAMMQLVSGLNESQWNFKPSSDRWSISEVVEHIVVNEQWTFGLMAENLTEHELGTNQGCRDC